MDLERDFTAWLERRDAGALARVFDGTAGRLLLLALHLAGPSGTAEDLVQSTFLAAMANAARWDRRRPLWPWLAGILQHEAQMHWRRQQRRREVDLGAAEHTAAGAPDPARLAASDEALTAVLAAIEALPLPYRQVLRLRLVHGLEPIEIARALEVPVGTVRAQLHRGLEHLRQALPAGVAVVVGAWLLGDAALLAQVKVQVLAKAAAMAVAAAGVVAPAGLLLTGGWWTGWWTMHGKTVGLVAAGAALLLGLGYLLGVPSGLLTRDPGETAPSPLSAVLGADAEARATEPQDAQQRTAAEVAPAPAWPLLVTVTTRGGKPVAGVAVRVWVASRGLEVMNQRQGDGQREAVAAGATAADGTFRCALDAFRARSPLFRAARYVFVAAGQRGAEQTVLALPRTNEPRTFAADIELSAATGITGHVVDAEGRPVAGAQLGRVARGSDRFEVAWERSGDDGTFWLATGGEPDQGPEQIVAFDPSLGIATAAVPRPTDPAEARTTIDVGTLVLDGRDAIRGQVVLGDGLPLGGYPLYVARVDEQLAADPVAIARSFDERAPGWQKIARSRDRPVLLVAEPDTLADGSFVCAGLDPDASYAVCVRDSRLQYSLLVARPGGGPVRLVVDRQLLSLDVRSEQGEVLQGIDLFAEGYDPERTHPSGRQRPGFPATGLCVGNPPYAADAGGRLMLLSPFGWIWRIGTSDENVQSDCLRHEAIAGVHRAERTFVLRPQTQFGTLHLSVVDEHGEPWREFDFELKGVDRDLFRTWRLQTPPADGMVRELPAGRWELTVHLGKQLRYGVWGMGPGARGTYEQEIVIEDARTTEVQVVAKPLGRVAFLLRADVPLGSLEDLRIRSETDGLEVAFETILTDSMIPGAPARRPVLFAKCAFAPGRHTFVITSRDHFPVRCEAEVVADRAVEVEVELLRQ